MSKNKYLYLVIAVVTFGLLLAGGTYAWLTFGPAIIGDNTYNGTSTCFLVDYNYENDDGTTQLGGTLFQSSAPKTGISGKVSMAMNSSCNVLSLGTIYLKVNSGTSSVLYSKVSKAHCEDTTTLRTMTDYTTSSTCTSAGYSWVNNVSALKYAVYEDINSNPVSVGYLDGVKDITIHNDFVLDTTARNFYVYVWLDGELANNNYLNVSFDGDVHLSADQIEIMYGDVDLDGDVDEDDSTYLFRYISQFEEYDLSEYAKLNSDAWLDGNLNNSDVIAIGRYLDGAEGFESLPYIPE